MSKFKKGDRVFVTGMVRAYTDGLSNIRALHEFTMRKAVAGVVIGYTFLRTGDREPSKGRLNLDADTFDDEYYEPAYLKNIECHKVWVVEPESRGERFVQPIKCLESQIEKAGVSEA